MSLILNVISVDNSPPSQKMEYKFYEKGGTIGRKFSNNWILADEDRHLSGSHAKVEYVNGDFYIVDTSTNGVFIDGSSTSLGRGGRVKLNNGMRLGMGGYDIAVNLAVHEKVVSDVVKSTQQDNDPFSDWGDSSGGDTDEVGSDIGEPIEKTSVKSQKIASDDPFFDFDDFFPDDGKKSQRDDKDERLENLPDLDSYFKPPEASNLTNKDKPEASRTIVEPESELGNDVEKNELDDSIIPDDWGTDNSNSIDDLLSGIDDPFDNQSVDNNDARKQDETIDDFFIEEAESVKSQNTENPQEQIDEAIPPSPSPVIEEDNKKREVEKAQPQGVSNSQNDLITAFLKGAGLNENLLEEGATEQHMLLVGKLFRTAIQGTMEVLRSRAEIKNEMRMDMTTIQPIQNNPIKFSVDTNEALQRLLVPTNKSYMDPEQALNESYDDIKAHQMAVIAGVQASLVHVLKRFEPEKLIERLEEESPISANIPIHRQAKLWNKFEDLYEAIEGEAEDDFSRLFGIEFAKAYDKQVDVLKKQRSENV